MKSAYFREGQHYSFSEIKKKFSLDDETAKKRINILRRCNILKIIRKEKFGYSDLSSQDLIINELPEDSSDFFYAFSFVGIILLENLVLKCYPKYIDNADEQNDAALIQKFKTIIKVIKKYNGQSQQIYLYNGEEERKTFNRLAISLYILQDYFENGLYTNQKENIELNGEGEISWNNTIDGTSAFIKQSAPYYLDFYTRKNEDNELDFIRRLHATIITNCSNELKNADILNLFDLDEAILTQEKIEDFGDTDFIKYRLEKELKTQFVTKKQNLLKTLYTYISEANSTETFETFSFYGTNSFNLVWEKVCAELFDSIREKTFGELKKNNIITEEKIENPNYDSEINSSCEEFLKDSEPFKNLIEKIKWTFNDFAVHAAETLEPDIISIYYNSFFILDAKYYCIKAEKNKIQSQPGIQDVVKQFAYHRAFLKFTKKFNFLNIVNAFLIPKKTSSELRENFRIAGKAELSLMQDYALKPLSPIQIVELEPEFVYSHYLNSKKITEKFSELLEKKNDADYSNKGEDFFKAAEMEKTVLASKKENNSSQTIRTYDIRH